MLTWLHLISRDFQSKIVGLIQTERKVATFEVENDNASQTATHKNIRICFINIPSTKAI